MPRAPRLLAISDRSRLVDGSLDGWRSWCAALAAAGVEALQVREPDLDDRDLWAWLDVARRAFPAPGRLLVNRRFDLALAVAGDGVQLPAHGLPVEVVRRAIGDRLLVGRSTHSLLEVEAARASGADFVLFGPIFDTPSKRGQIAPRGLEALAEAGQYGIPVVAVGGIDADRIASVIGAGAHGIAAIRAFADVEGAGAMVTSLQEATA